MDPLRRHPLSSEDRYHGDGYASSIGMTTSPAVVDDQPPEDLRGPGLSFERDIQPLSKRYFAQTFGRMRNPLHAAAAFASADAGLKQAYVQNAQIREMDEQSRGRRANYETAVFALESARDKARKDRDLLSSLAPLQAELDGALNNPDLDLASRKKLIGGIGIKYGGLSADSPAAANMINSARFGLADEDKKKHTVSKFLESTQGQGVGYLQELEKRLGRPLVEDEEVPYVDSYAWLEKHKASTYASKEGREAADASAKEDRANIEKALDYTKDIKFAKDPLDTNKVTDNLADPADEAVLDTLIDRFAFPEEKKAATSARAKHELAKRIRIDRLTNPANRPLRAAPASTRSTVSAGMLGPSK